MGKEKVFKTICLIETIVIIGLSGLLVFKCVDKKDTNIVDNNKPNNSEINKENNNNENNNDNNVNEDESNIEEDETTSNEEFVEPIGKVMVKGYAYTEVIDYSDSYEGAKPFTRIYFKVIETDNKDFSDYLKEHNGNSFLRNNSIALGCLEKNNIIRDFHTDEMGYIHDAKIGDYYVEQILNSSENNIITIEILFSKSSLATEVSGCFSPFTNIINIIENK